MIPKQEPVVEANLTGKVEPKTKKVAWLSIHACTHATMQSETEYHQDFKLVYSTEID